jgi:hypothetical protein
MLYNVNVYYVLVKMTLRKSVLKEKGPGVNRGLSISHPLVCYYILFPEPYSSPGKNFNLYLSRAF